MFNIPAKAAGLPEGVPHNQALEDGSVQLKYVEGVRLLESEKSVTLVQPSSDPFAGVASLYLRSLQSGCKIMI